ncbi:MAG: carboxymuconolactone decarboxylase family protein [Acidimicrobiales bacterium]
MDPRISNPALLLPGLLEAIRAVSETARAEGLDETVVNLVHIRASQINGCSVCCDMHNRTAKKAGERDERLFTVAAWRETPYFSDAERAALALTEAMTRIADRPEAVSDEIFSDAAAHFDEKALAALIVQIAMINTWNRLNAATRQITGDWVDHFS